jgi:hypothetical protein
VKLLLHRPADQIGGLTGGSGVTSSGGWSVGSARPAEGSLA